MITKASWLLRALPMIFALGLALLPRPARADVSFDFFYDNLSPYGEWVDVGDYGTCWRPTNVDPDWSPYTDGYWAYTDGGWTWVSYEDFGPIVYHYGRWIHVDDGSWCWWPDYDWAPAWVSWRYSDDYVGWAPLPPEARWRRHGGISIWVDSVCDIGPGYYSFCRVRDFGAPVLRPVIVNRVENVTIINRTVNVTNITYNTGYGAAPVIFNGGPSFEAVSQASARPVPTLKLVVNSNIPGELRRGGGPGMRAYAPRTIGNQLIVTAPQVAPPSDPSQFRGRVAISADKVSKGWGIVKNPQQAQQIRQEMQRQTKGFTPDSAPAHAVAGADLKFVPSKADPHATAPSAADEAERQRLRSAHTSGRPQPLPGAVPTPAVASEPPRESGRRQETAPTSGIAPGNPVLKPFNPTGQNEPPSGRGSAGNTTSGAPAEMRRQSEIEREQAAEQAARARTGQSQPLPPKNAGGTPSGPSPQEQQAAQQRRAEMQREQAQASEQERLRAEQERKQADNAARIEAAKAKVEEARRAEMEARQPKDERARAEAEKERSRPQTEPPHPAGNPQPHPGNNPPAHGKESKDSKDKKDS